MEIHAVLRNGKIGLSNGKWSSVDAASKHNCRTGYQQENVDPDRTWANELLIGTTNLSADIKKRLKEVGVKPARKDAVVCREAVLTASPEFWGDDWKGLLKNAQFKKKLDLWVKQSLKFFTDKYGLNVVQATLHMDETTPHMHIMFVPLVEKNGKFELNAKSEMARWKLREMQTEYAQAVENLGLVRGKPASKTGAKHEHFRSYKTRKDLENKLAKVTDERNNLEQENKFLRQKAVEQDRVIKTQNEHVQARIQEGVQAQSEHLRLQYEAELNNIVDHGKRMTRLSLQAQPTQQKPQAPLASNPSGTDGSSFNL